ncbi:MAG: hypothetical protein WC906_05010 [Parcubacteria group bacterium]|jgi:hypothetical protein
MAGKIVCKKDVVMKGGDNEGEVAFTDGKEYDVWMVMSSEFIVILTTDNFGNPHHLLETGIHSSDSKFICEYFDLSSLSK